MDWKAEIQTLLENLKADRIATQKECKWEGKDTKQWCNGYDNACERYGDELARILARAEAEAEDGSQQTGNGT